jgi:hypothetical protein
MRKSPLHYASISDEVISTQVQVFCECSKGSANFYHQETFIKTDMKSLKSFELLLFIGQLVGLKGSYQV